MAAAHQPNVPPPPPPPPPRPGPRVGGLHRFWDRVTEGMAVEQLWSQFRTEAQSSYRLYSKDVQPMEPGGRSAQSMHRFWHTVSQFFWAILLKLTPPRRVLLVASLVMMLVGPIVVKDEDGKDRFNLQLGGLGTAGILLVLVLEIADRVTMKRDLQIAREIQSWLEPKAAPPMPQLDVAFVTRPANTVAGDYYDAFRRTDANGNADGPLLLIVADVAGKSIPAAMLMATLHASLHTLARHPGPLSELVAGLNGYCCENSNNGSRFTTAFIAEFDPATRTLTSVNAGHNAPVLLRETGNLERLSTGGIPLGITPGLPYQTATHVLAPGDVLFIFTDGLVEAENSRQQEFGEDPLLPLLVANRALPSAEMIAQVMRNVEVFVADTPQHDDITCMAVRVAA